MSSLYLHIPFCSSKCPYCDFYSQVGSSQQLDEYIELLCTHLQFLHHSSPDPVKLETIFFGGGTPSLLTPDQVGTILQQLSKTFGITAEAEISLEANPGTLDGQKLEGYRSEGINRLSLGVQSLRDEQLQMLGRIHSSIEAIRAVEMIRSAGFENLSLDLIFNLPGQSSDSLEKELEELLALRPEHLSLYGLSFEEGTVFEACQRAGEISAVDEDESAAQYLMLHQKLQAAGYEHYEISNFSRPGYRSCHNQVYWQRRSCLAAGCGAHSFNAAGWGERRVVPPDLVRYRNCLERQQDPSEQVETFGRKEAMAETLYLALRTSDGIDSRSFAELYGEAPDCAFPRAFALLSEHLQQNGDRWSFRPESWLLYDHLISHFL